VNRIQGLVAQLGASRKLRRLIALGISALSVLMIASFVAKNAGVTKADVARYWNRTDSVTAVDLIADRRYYLHRIFEPNAGETEALPAVVNQGIDLARTHRLREVGLSPGLLADDHIRMYFGEGLYPIRLDRTHAAALVLVGTEDQQAPSCDLIDQRPLVRLVRCQ
jgi:hypothetical protein